MKSFGALLSRNISHDFTHVVVGGGSAGCVLASRISEDSSKRVLLLEAGPDDRASPLWWWIHMPSAMGYSLTNNRFNWGYKTTSQWFGGGREIYTPRGRVLGGSSSINAMVYIRGHPLDYDRWETEGAHGWSYADCLPYFKKAEGWTGPDEGTGDTFRGRDGPLQVQRLTGTSNPLYRAWLEAGEQAGYGTTLDMNGYRQEGMGFMDMTMTASGGRCSAAEAYIRPIVNERDNLVVVTGALATKVITEHGRATGVRALQFNGTEGMDILASEEVIVATGAINTPQLLQLSGIGPAKVLSDAGVELVLDLPGVGENLQDHLEVFIQHALRTEESTHGLYKYQWKYPHNMIRAGLDWFLNGKGIGATNHMEVGGFVRTNDDVEHPNLQYHFLPAAIGDYHNPLGDCPAFQAHVGTLRAKSRGSIRIKSSDPKEYPEIEPNYLTHEDDMRELREAIHVTRKIFAQPAFDRFRGKEIRPGPDVQTDEELDNFIYTSTESAMHPSCTCKMGVDDMSVVDAYGKVYGIEGLRVCDASIMPSILSGNLNAPTIMMAEKIADSIRGVAPLPREENKVWTHHS